MAVCDVTICIVLPCLALIGDDDCVVERPMNRLCGTGPEQVSGATAALLSSIDVATRSDCSRTARASGRFVRLSFVTRFGQIAERLNVVQPTNMDQRVGNCP
jgi:hypothetical protein